jgi:hypothetical protein
MIIAHMLIVQPKDGLLPSYLESTYPEWRYITGGEKDKK